MLRASYGLMVSRGHNCESYPGASEKSGLIGLTLVDMSEQFKSRCFNIVYYDSDGLEFKLICMMY